MQISKMLMAFNGGFFRGKKSSKGSLTMAVVAAIYVAGNLFFTNFALAAEDGDEIVEEVLVTGSRIKRDEFTSATPIQILKVDTARQIGISSITELLQRSTMTSGQQLDSDINTGSGNSNATEAPVFGGVGSANIGLRGLGPERTLVLVNSRRLGSSGVRGAPAQPDLNLIPLNIVESVEVITEGASSVYGADAVAGVVNVKLRDSYEGFEISVNAEQPFDDGGEVQQFSFITGASSENSRFVFSGEYYDRKRLSLGDREDCIISRPVTQSGETLQRCSNGFPDNIVFSLDRLFDGDATTGAFVFYTPGVSAANSDIGVQNFQSSFALPPAPGTNNQFDESLDQGNRDNFLPFYSDTDDRLASDLVQPLQTISLISLGGFSPEWFGGNEEIYYEMTYMNRQVNNRATAEQIFPAIPMDIPSEDANGNLVVDATGALVLSDNPLNPFNSTDWAFNPGIVVTLDDLPQDRKVELQQFRIVTGFKGDFTSDWLGDRNWSYDIFGSYDRGTGFQEQPLMSETNLDIALETLRFNAAGNLTCGIQQRSNDLGFITQQPCVIIDFFADSLYSANGEGTFATAAERNFLIGSRLNRTVVEQTMFAAFVTGELMELPSGDTLKVAIGAEYRKDEIDSATEFLGTNGLVAAEVALTEGATGGSRDITDFYLEFSAPLVSDVPGIDYLELEGAVRFTDESNFGKETTYRARLTYKPIDWVTASASFGTSFRAPNLREQFLADQFSGTASRSDPCAIPAEANIGGVYMPQLDTRPQIVFDNCALSGANPTVLGLGAGTTIPVRVGGNTSDLEAETSDSFTATVQFSPPISDAFDLDVAVSFYDIEVKKTVRSVAAGTILDRCFNDAPNLSSPFCDRVQRDSSGTIPDTLNFVSSIDASFLNLGKETSKGFDVNARLSAQTELLGGLNFSWTTQFTKLLESDEQIFAGDIVEDKVGDFGRPEHRLNTTLAMALGDWEWLIAGRYIDGTEASDAAALSARCGIFGITQSLAGSPLTAPTCNADDAWYFDSSVTYIFNETFVVSAGVNNAFDKEPGKVSLSAGSNRGGRVVGSGYDQFGRSWFVNFTKAF